MKNTVNKFNDFINEYKNNQEIIDKLKNDVHRYKSVNLLKVLDKLKSLKKYDFNNTKQNFVESKNGEYVIYSDVEKIIISLLEENKKTE